MSSPRAHRYPLIAGTAVLALSLAGCATPAPEAAGDDSHEAAHWAYADEEGPANRGVLDDDYATCGTGSSQSPIDLPAAVPVGSLPFSIGTDAAEGVLVDTGHTMQFSPGDEATEVDFGDDEYEMLQTHVHAPSEHTVAGVQAAAEFHLVHSGEDGELLVVGVLVREGAVSAAWQPFVEAAAAGEGTIELDFTALLPADLGYYSYTGSLTTPPCTEDVEWVVLATPVELSAEQIDVLNEASHDNARPTMPLGDRTVAGGTGTAD
jgi:carbonic anhydrase